MLRFDSNHSFDWNGLGTFAKVLVGVVMLGSAGQFSLAQATGAAYESVALRSDAVIAAHVRRIDPAALSTTTPQKIIRKLSINDVIPATGKFIVADLSQMQLTLYQDGSSTAQYPIITKGRPGTPWETPAGYYQIHTKEDTHLSSIGHVFMPYSMQFYGNYFIHGWPYYADGTPVSSDFSGGCIRLNTADAQKVYEFADRGTGLFVYDPPSSAPTAPVALGPTSPPKLSAEAYLVADIDTGDVYLDHGAQMQEPIASVSKLMTALVANETISFDKKIAIREEYLFPKGSPGDVAPKKFLVGDLFYPLLMQSSNGVAESLADYYGTGAFVGWMNATAHSLDMASTSFAEPSGLSADNVSTPDDLYRLAVYLINKKSFIWDITRTPDKTLVASDGSHYPIANFNKFFNNSDFIGGKVGYTDEADHTMVSLFTFTVSGQQHRVAFIVLQSKNSTADTKALMDWYAKAAQTGQASNTACASCSIHTYRKIDL